MAAAAAPACRRAVICMLSQFQLNDFQFTGGVTQLHAGWNSCLATPFAPQTPVRMEHANMDLKKKRERDTNWSFAFFLPLIKRFRVAENFTTHVKVQNLIRSHLTPSHSPIVRILFPDTFLLQTLVTGNAQSQSSPYMKQAALPVTSMSGMILLKAHLPPSCFTGSLWGQGLHCMLHCSILGASLCPAHVVGSQ